jgi:uncharacterized protein (TIGR02246 family)
MPSDFVATETAIRQLHSRYVDAVWRQDAAAVGKLFAPDGEWRVGGQVMRGPAEIEHFLKGAFKQFKRLLMTFRTPIVDFGDGVATSRTYVSENSQYADGRPYGPVGIYFDRFVEVDGKWLFKWRMFQTHYSGPPSFDGGDWYEVKDYGPPPGMPPLDEATYDRSGVGAKAIRGGE